MSMLLIMILLFILQIQTSENKNYTDFSTQQTIDVNTQESIETSQMDTLVSLPETQDESHELSFNHENDENNIKPKDDQAKKKSPISNRFLSCCFKKKYKSQNSKAENTQNMPINNTTIKIKAEIKNELDKIQEENSNTDSDNESVKVVLSRRVSPLSRRMSPLTKNESAILDSKTIGATKKQRGSLLMKRRESPWQPDDSSNTGNKNLNVQDSFKIYEMTTNPRLFSTQNVLFYVCRSPDVSKCLQCEKLKQIFAQSHLREQIHLYNYPKSNFQTVPSSENMIMAYNNGIPTWLKIMQIIVIARQQNMEARVTVNGPNFTDTDYASNLQRLNLLLKQVFVNYRDRRNGHVFFTLINSEFLNNKLELFLENGVIDEEDDFVNIENVNKEEGGTRVINKMDDFENTFLFDGILDVVDPDTDEEIEKNN